MTINFRMTADSQLLAFTYRYQVFVFRLHVWIKACSNHRVPKRAETTAATAASLLERPEATACQIRHKAPSFRIGDRSGEHYLFLVERSGFRSSVVIACSVFKVPFGVGRITSDQLVGAWA
jgi:hypothetical protein